MPTTETGVTILQRLLAHESLAAHLQFIQIQRFFELTLRLWPEVVPPGQSLPLALPLLVSQFISAALQIDPIHVQLTWSAFSDLVEAAHNKKPDLPLDDLFRIHSHSYSTGVLVQKLVGQHLFYSFRGPTTRPTCVWLFGLQILSQRRNGRRRTALYPSSWCSSYFF